jgi:hypothetical protein
MTKGADKSGGEGGQVIDLFSKGKESGRPQELKGVTFREIRGMDMVVGSHTSDHMTLKYGAEHGYKLDPGSICGCLLRVYENTVRSFDIFAKDSAFYTDQFRKILMVLPEWQELLVEIERHNQLWLSLVAAQFRLEQEGRKRFGMEIVDGILTITGDEDQFDEDTLALVEEERALSARNSEAIHSLINYGLQLAIRLFKGVAVEMILREISGRTKGLTAVPADSE